MKKQFLFILFVFITFSLASCGSTESSHVSVDVGAESGYASVDTAQVKKLEDIAAFMDDYLEEQGYFVMDYSVEWIGYSKYKDMYSEEEYEDFETGGYYSYTGSLSIGDLATGRIYTYWEDGESPEILNLTIENYTEETVIVEYSEEKITECWNIYLEKSGK